MEIKKFIFMTILMMSCISSMNALTSSQDEYPKITDLRHQIGLDYTMPDYSVKKIDEKKIGSRLCKYLRYLGENYKQGIYNRWLARIIGEQNESLQNTYIELRKIKLKSISKTGNEITIIYKATIDAKLDQQIQTDVTFHFIDGVSESKSVNDLFSYMSRYVSAREKLE